MHFSDVSNTDKTKSLKAKSKLIKFGHSHDCSTIRKMEEMLKYVQYFMSNSLILHDSSSFKFMFLSIVIA